jgi:broad specificity phosphatase PhoE
VYEADTGRLAHRAAQPTPGGELGDYLTARPNRALASIAAQTRGMDAVVIAHGASVRAAAPVVTGQHDHGRDLATGDVARISVTYSHGMAVQVAMTTQA